MNSIRRLNCLALAFSLVAMAASQAATPKEWSIKLRAAYLETADESDAFSALGIDFAEGAVSVEDKWIPELDIAYGLTENVVFEIALTIPQKHSVYLEGLGKLGSLEHLPPTFSFVYEFNTEGSITPYVSGGRKLYLDNQ